MVSRAKTDRVKRAGEYLDVVGDVAIDEGVGKHIVARAEFKQL
jgi:hypothetical protein